MVHCIRDLERITVCGLSQWEKCHVSHLETDSFSWGIGGLAMLTERTHPCRIRMARPVRFTKKMAHCIRDLETIMVCGLSQWDKCHMSHLEMDSFSWGTGGLAMST